MECEFLSSEDAPGQCQILPSWISYGNRLESVQTRMKGVALELSRQFILLFLAQLKSLMIKFASKKDSILPCIRGRQPQKIRLAKFRLKLNWNAGILANFTLFKYS